MANEPGGSQVGFFTPTADQPGRPPKARHEPLGFWRLGLILASSIVVVTALTVGYSSYTQLPRDRPLPAIDYELTPAQATAVAKGQLTLAGAVAGDTFTHGKIVHHFKAGAVAVTAVPVVSARNQDPGVVEANSVVIPALGVKALIVAEGLGEWWDKRIPIFPQSL